MGLLQSVKKGLGSLLGGAKAKLDQTSSGLKSSVESFVGDIIIRSTINRAKSSVLDMLREDSSQPGQESEPTAASALPAVISSDDLMKRLMGNFSEPMKKAAKTMTSQLDSTLANVGDEITKELKRTVRSTIEGIKADDIVGGLSQFLNSSLQQLSGEEGPEGTKESENLNFNLNGTGQMFGWILMAIGALLLASGLNQDNLNPEQAKEEHDTPSLSF